MVPRRTAAEKVRDLDDLAVIVKAMQGAGKRVAHCHGVFDLLHLGHVRHLQAASVAADTLVVTVTPDRFVNKGPGRPAFPEAARAEMVAALECVEAVAVNRWPTAVETIHLLAPDLYVKGSEYREEGNDVTDKIRDERAAIHAVGGELHFTDDVVYSSTELLNRHFDLFSPEVAQWLAAHRERIDSRGIIDRLKASSGTPIRLLSRRPITLAPGSLVTVRDDASSFRDEIVTNAGRQPPAVPTILWAEDATDVTLADQLERGEAPIVVAGSNKDAVSALTSRLSPSVVCLFGAREGKSVSAPCVVGVAQDHAVEIVREGVTFQAPPLSARGIPLAFGPEVAIAMGMLAILGFSDEVIALVGCIVAARRAADPYTSLDTIGLCKALLTFLK